jgi:hypothetical protein
MEALQFVLMLGCLVLVLGWYLGNEAAGAGGRWGLLAVRRDDDEGKSGPRYRLKLRLGGRRLPAAESEPAFRRRGDDGYRNKDDREYRATGARPRYSDKESGGGREGPVN